ncbi:MAG: winged helix-turn-helix domain-containing protein, partial [Steroidobacteraceae bacterium]
MDTSTPAAADADQARFQVDDLLIDIGQQRVTRAGVEIPLPHLSFALLVTLARAAPNLVTFDQLTERVWTGLVITPETISQRVKLVRTALGDDPQAPHYIGGVRGRGYRMVASVRPLTERRRSEPATPYWM